MKEQESNLLECFAVYMFVIFMYMKFYEKHERENKNGEDGIISFLIQKLKSAAKPFLLTPFMYIFSLFLLFAWLMCYDKI